MFVERGDIVEIQFFESRLQTPVTVPVADGSESGRNPVPDPKFRRSGHGSGRFFFNLKIENFDIGFSLRCEG